MKKRNGCAISEHAKTRLLNYSDEVLGGSIDLVALSVSSPEIEIYRKHFLDTNGETCLMYRLSLMLLAVSSMPEPDTDKITILSQYLNRYPIYRPFVCEIEALKQQIIPN